MDPCLMVSHSGIYVMDYKGYQIFYVLISGKRNYVIRYTGFLSQMRRMVWEFAGHTLKETKDWVRFMLYENNC